MPRNSFALTIVSELTSLLEETARNTGPQRNALNRVAGMVMNLEPRAGLESDRVRAALSVNQALFEYSDMFWHGGDTGSKLVVRPTSALFDRNHYWAIDDSSGVLRPGHFVTGKIIAPRSPADGDGIITQVITVNGDPKSEVERISRWPQKGAQVPKFGIYRGKVGLLKTVTGTHQGIGTSSLIIAPPNASKTGTMNTLLSMLMNGLTPVVIVAGEREMEARATSGPIAVLRHTRNLFDASSVTSPLEQIVLVEIILQHIMRLAEQGEHVVLFLDSVSMLADALNFIDMGGKTRSGGIEPAMIQLTRLLIALGRWPEGRKGSITVVLNILNRGDTFDQTLMSVAKATSNGQDVLDPVKRARGMFRLPPLKYGVERIKTRDGGIVENQYSVDRTMFGWCDDLILVNAAQLRDMLNTDGENQGLGLFWYEVLDCVLEEAMSQYPHLNDQTTEGREEYGAAVAHVFERMGIYEGTSVHLPRFQELFPKFPRLQEVYNKAVAQGVQIPGPGSPVTAQSQRPSNPPLQTSRPRSMGGARHPLKPQRSSTN